MSPSIFFQYIPSVHINPDKFWAHLLWLTGFAIFFLCMYGEWLIFFYLFVIRNPVIFTWVWKNICHSSCSVKLAVYIPLIYFAEKHVGPWLQTSYGKQPFHPINIIHFRPEAIFRLCIILKWTAVYVAI